MLTLQLKDFGAGKGAWAVITGCTDGIGREFAYQLAAAKFNVVLISRTQSKLDELEQEIKSTAGVDTKTYAMDFSKGDLKDYDKVKTLLDPLTVGVLINNVGVAYDYPMPFALLPDNDLYAITEININGTLRMSRIVLPGMMERKNGLVLNVGSFSGLVASPYLAIYGASKAFLCAMSQAVGTELEEHGVLFENLNTYFVSTKLAKITRESWLIPSPRTYVKSVLRHIGMQGGASTPHTLSAFHSHAIVNWLIDNLFTVNFWVKQNYSIQKDLRKRWLRKQARRQAALEAEKKGQ